MRLNVIKFKLRISLTGLIHKSFCSQIHFSVVFVLITYHFKLPPVLVYIHLTICDQIFLCKDCVAIDSGT